MGGRSLPRSSCLESLTALHVRLDLLSRQSCALKKRCVLRSTVCTGTCVRVARDFAPGKLSARVDLQSADETGLTALALGLKSRDPESAPICYIFGVRPGVQKRVLTYTLLLGTLLGTGACLPTDRVESASELEVSHEQYPEFEAFSDTQSAVLTGSGGAADWLEEASHTPGLDSTGDRLSSGQGSFESGSGSAPADDSQTGTASEGSDESQASGGEGSSDETSESGDSQDSSGENKTDESSDEGSSGTSSGGETWTSTEPVQP